MKTTLSLSIILLTFLGIIKAAPPDANPPQLLIQAKFVEFLQSDTGPLAGAPLPAPLDVAKKEPGLVGTFTDPQFQAIIRGLNQRKGVDLMSAPQVTTKIGQQGSIEITRKLAYMDESGKGAVKNVGITLTALSNKAVEDQFDLVVSPQIVEFDGFINHKNGWDEPIFKERKVTETVVMASGQTIVLELDPKIDKQIVEEENEAGQVISSKTVLNKRRTLVFITAQLIDPATNKPRVPKQPAINTR